MILFINSLKEILLSNNIYFTSYMLYFFFFKLLFHIDSNKKVLHFSQNLFILKNILLIQWNIQHENNSKSMEKTFIITNHKEGGQ